MAVRSPRPLVQLHVSGRRQSQRIGRGRAREHPSRRYALLSWIWGLTARSRPPDRSRRDKGRGALNNETQGLSVVQAAPHARSAVELKDIIEAERRGLPFLLWRDADGTQQLFELSGLTQVTIGRRSSNDVVLAADGEVSRTHARLELIGEDWTIADDGLSRNGTHINGARISQRKRLARNIQ
jgi:hypothetical protein